jgi:hypothetical protein
MRKYSIYEIITKSTLLYKSEIWKITERNKRKLETIEIDVFKKIMRISRRDSIKNKEIGTWVEIEDRIMKEKQFICPTNERSPTSEKSSTNISTEKREKGRLKKS